MLHRKITMNARQQQKKVRSVSERGGGGGVLLLSVCALLHSLSLTNTNSCSSDFINISFRINRISADASTNF